MKISIITVCFNSENTIFDTLESVQSQNYENIEHIIVDGKSTDNTLNIIKKFKHVSKIISEEDNGIYDAMNKGIKISNGDIIGFLNSDDTFFDEYSINTIIQPFFLYSNIDIIYGDLNYIDFKKRVIRNWISDKYEKNNFLTGWCPPHPTFYAKKKIYEKYGNFNEKIGNPADFELMYRMMYKNKLKTYYINKKLVNMKLGGISNKSVKNIIKQNLSIINILKKNKDFNLINFIIKKLIARLKQYKIKNSL